MILNRRRDREKARTALREDLKKFGIRTTTTTRTRKGSIITALDFLYNIKDETVLWNILSFVACERVNVGLWLSENFEKRCRLDLFLFQLQSWLRVMSSWQSVAIKIFLFVRGHCGIDLFKYCCCNN